MLRKMAGIAPPVSSELQQLLAEAEQRVQLPATTESTAPSPEEEIEAVLPAELLASLDEALDEDDDEDEIVAPPRAPVTGGAARERTDGGGTRTTGASTTGSGATPAAATQGALAERDAHPAAGGHRKPHARGPAAGALQHRGDACAGRRLRGRPARFSPGPRRRRRDAGCRAGDRASNDRVAVLRCGGHRASRGAPGG